MTWKPLAFASYVIFMNYLINTIEDVNVMRKYKSTRRTYVRAACATYYLMGGSEEDCTLFFLEI
uniref:Uncharacterized protein n=1 Tax=Physcomitrium patens TaxID=3218 RepID=A0A2K1JLX3_PHYPA|nr:hypothetical protein PHYPA_017374 [Physcomitrium patens]